VFRSASFAFFAQICVSATDATHLAGPESHVSVVSSPEGRSNPWSRGREPGEVVRTRESGQKKYIYLGYITADIADSKLSDRVPEYATLDFRM
jgi:hypothetical protein